MDQNIPIQRPSPEKPPMFSVLATIIVIVAIAGYIASASLYNLWPFSYTGPELEAILIPRVTDTMKTYTNDEIGFQFEHPKGGEVEKLATEINKIVYRSPELVEDIRVNPERYTGDVVADVYVDVIEGGFVGDIVEAIGIQFDDREEEMETIDIDGVSAIKAMVWTGSDLDWVWIGVFIEAGDNLIKIENGASVDRPKIFEDFYKSFKLIN